MFNNKRSSYSSRSNRKRGTWNSSMVGSHHSGQGRYSAQRRNTRQRAYSSQRRTTSLNGRVGEVSQVRPNVTGVDRRTASMNTNRSRTEEYMKKRRINSLLGVVIVLALVLFFALNLGSCAYKASVSGSMAINDAELSKNLTAAKEGEPYYVLLSGISNPGQNGESLDYAAILRVDKANNKISLVDIPTNLAVSTSQKSTDLLSNLTKVDGEAALVSHISDTFGIKINHYIRISDKGFVEYMNSLGGLTVDVTQRIDDPSVSSEVITTGTQTLKDDKILTFVKASNYTNGFETQASNQQKALEALLKGITSKSGFDYMSSMDILSNAIKTDLSIEGIEEILNVYTASSDFPYAPAPVTASVINDVHYSYLASSKWSAMSEQFINGENPSISIDTSGVDKASLSIIVLNASGIDGFAAQVTSVLTSKGYTVQETGNNNYQDFSETLVVYKSDRAAAESIVEDLGVGRAVAAGFNYTLTTEIQVMVGKDWKPLE